MNPTAARAEAICQAALALFGGPEREALISAECGDDLALEMRVRRLVREREGAGGSPEEAPLSPEIEAELARLKPEEEGERIGPYKLREQVGEGGFGAVWVADQELPVKRRVALKIIKLGMDTKEVIARFEQERQALAMMDHSNIARVLDAGATQFGRPFFVMELVRGIPITDYCDQANLSTAQRLDLFIQVCHAVQHAHQKGIIHRDLKPSNILVTLHDGLPVPKVIDFGIAKATEGRLTNSTVYTQMHQFVGTPAYMSPEQAEMSGLDIDTRSDIYSLGVLLYELLAGSTPFDAQELVASGIEAMRKTIREKEPVRPSTKLATLKGDELTTTARRRSVATSKLANLLRGDLDWIVMKCLEKDRSRRYDTANGLAADLKRHLNNEPVVARPPSAAYRLQKSFRRNKLVFTSAIAVAAALVFGMFVSVWQAARAMRAEHEQTHLREAAEKARQQAEAAQTSETRLRKLAQLQAYAADMKAAQVALQQNSRQQAVTLLDQYWPNPGEPDLRGIEWRYLWQAARGDEAYTWKHPGMVAGALFSPDGKQVATACFDGVLRIWNVASGKRAAQFDREVSDESVLLSFCFAPDGATLASASREGIVLLDCATWEVKRTLEMAEDERPSLTRMSLIYSPDGRWLAASLNRQKIRLWNTATWESFTLPSASEERISFSPDSKTLAVCSGVIELWDVATRKKADVFDGNTPAFFLAEFSPQGDRLVSAGFLGHVSLWDNRSKKQVWSQQAHRSPVYGVAFSHDGKRFASGGFDQLIHIWDAATQEKVMTHPGEKAVGFTPEGRGLISITGDGVTLRHWKGAQVIKSLPFAEPLDLNQITFSPETQSLYARSPGGEVRIYDVNNLNLKRSFKISEPCSLLNHVSPDGRWLTGRGTTFRDLHVWDTASGESVAHIMECEDSSASRDLAIFSPDSHVLAVATAQWQIRLWDTTKREFFRTLGPLHWRLNGMSFSPDGRKIASSSWAGDVRIFEMATGRETMAPLYGHGSGVHAQGFSPDGATLVSGGDDSSVRFWNVATGREMLVFADAFNPAARLPFLSPAGELLVWRDRGQNLRLRVQSIPTLVEIEKAHGAESTAR